MRLVLLVALAALAAACNSGPAQTEVEGTLMAVQTQGGMCMEGLCETTIYLESDGLVHVAAKPPNELGVVPADAMAQLKTQIAAADFDEIRSHPFTGTCPTAFDGAEVIFEFQTSEAVERIESCQTEVDYTSPLFSAVLAAVGGYVGLGVPSDGPGVPEAPPVPIR